MIYHRSEMSGGCIKIIRDVEGEEELDIQQRPTNPMQSQQGL